MKKGATKRTTTKNTYLLVQQILLLFMFRIVRIQQLHEIVLKHVVQIQGIDGLSLHIFSLARVALTCWQAYGFQFAEAGGG